MMYVVAETRCELMRLLRKGTKGCEVRVAEGNFSEEMLRTVQPSTLHLVDCWQCQDSVSYRKDISNVPQKQQDARLQKVLERFASDIERGQVVVHRMFAGEAVTLFGPAMLDWVYLDGNHGRDAVLEDLVAYAEKVAPDGWLCGHDYSNSPWAERMGFGVIEAVNGFIDESDFEMIALTRELYPSYLLVRSGEAAEDAKRRIRDVLSVVWEGTQQFPPEFRICFDQPSPMYRFLNELAPSTFALDSGKPKWHMEVEGEIV